MVGIDVPKLKNIGERAVVGLEGLHLVGCGVAPRRHVGDVLTQAVGLGRKQELPRVVRQLLVQVHTDRDRMILGGLRQVTRAAAARRVGAKHPPWQADFQRVAVVLIAHHDPLRVRR